MDRFDVLQAQVDRFTVSMNTKLTRHLITRLSKISRRYPRRTFHFLDAMGTVSVDIHTPGHPDLIVPANNAPYWRHHPERPLHLYPEAAARCLDDLSALLADYVDFCANHFGADDLTVRNGRVVQD